MLYTKVLNPATHGKKVYANTGSVRRATNYLAQEAKLAGSEGAEFFGAESAGKLSADQVVELLDNNHGGLRRNAVKFHSLVLSPDQEQLALLGNQPDELRKFTRSAMALYAGNFTLKDERVLSEKDLVWAATLHRARKNRGTDEGLQGAKKHGLQTHIHVVVSARDREQKITLNPLGTVARFNRVAFQAAVGIEMRVGRVRIEDGLEGKTHRQELEAARAREIQSRVKRTEKELTPKQVEEKNARLDLKVVQLNEKLPTGLKLDPEQVKEAALERKYDAVFYNRLSQIGHNADAGKLTIESIEYLRTGRVQQGTQLIDWVPQGPPPMNQALIERLMKPKDWSKYSAVDVIEKRINELASALKMPPKLQHVQDEREQSIDRGREM